MITAEEFFRRKLREIHPSQESITLSQMIITAEQGMRWGYEYAILKSKFHVEEALKQASENAEIDYELGNPYDANSRYDVVDKKSILEAYPLENIK